MRRLSSTLMLFAPTLVLLAVVGLSATAYAQNEPAQPQVEPAAGTALCVWGRIVRPVLTPHRSPGVRERPS